MKTLFTFLLIIFCCKQTALGQALHIDSSRFITGLRCCTQINFALPTADKGILFTGQESGNPGGIIPYFPLDTGENGNVLVGKIDSNQQISWIKVYGGSGDDGAGPSCQMPDGGYAVLAGTTSDDGDVTGFKGEADIWLLRLDGSGNLLWQKCFGDSIGGTGGTSMARTADNGFILLGNSNGYGYDVPFHYGDEFSEDWVVIKTDSLGNKQWCKVLGGTGNEQGNGSILAFGKSYYLISSTNSTDYDCTDTAWHQGVNTMDDYYILKLDDTGKVLWDSSYGGSGNDDINYAFLDTRDSTIVITGTTNSNDHMVTGYHDWGDMWVIKVNMNGTLLWQKALGSTQTETGTGVCPAQNGGYIAYGETDPVGAIKDSAIGDIGLQDCWLFALDSAGNEVANKIFGGVGPDDSKSIIPYLNGYVAVGTSGSSVFTEGSCNVNYSGAFVSYIDYWPLTVNEIYNPLPQLFIYPNPSHEKIIIETPEEEQGILIILNCAGQTIYATEISVPKKNIDIDVTEWADGVYCILWQGADGTIYKTKMIKN